MLETINVRIDDQGSFYWDELEAHCEELHEMLNDLRPLIYNSDLKKYYNGILNRYPNLSKEITHISNICNVKVEEILALNIFYDNHKLLCGCTSFVTNSSDGPIQLHSLDWDTAKETLEKYLKFFRYKNEIDGSTIYSIGWPGYIGIFWGVRQKGFSVTLNAVWSEVKANISYPLGVFIRDVFIKSDNYLDAINLFEKSEISSDCILTVSGIIENEFAIIERTPVHSFIREDNRYCLATNHYCSLKAGANRDEYVITGDEIFGENSDERFDKAESYLKNKLPSKASECFELAGKEPIANELTMLKAVYKAATGELLVKLPKSDKFYIPN